jgi:hypothetical protein
MDLPKLAFINFLEKLSILVASTCCFTDKDLAKLTSYFWEKIDPEIRNLYKYEAHSLNKSRHLTGKKRKRGFWVFALDLELTLLNQDIAFFNAIWFHLDLKWKNYWREKTFNLICQEIERVIM